jgi:hypothetical protein
LTGGQEVAGSNPASPTTKYQVNDMGGHRAGVLSGVPLAFSTNRLRIVYESSTNGVRMAAQRVATGVYKAGVGVYDVHVSTGKGVDGKYGKVTKRVRGSLAQAREERVRMLGEVSAGLLKPAEPLTMADHR